MDGEPSNHHIWENKLQHSGALPMSLPLKFLEAITCDFSDERVLGSGGYGVVYKGVLQNGKVIAVKKLMETLLIQDKQFQNEVSYFLGIKHQNIVQLVGYCAESQWQVVEYNRKYIWAESPKRLLCFEYLPNGSLDKHLSNESCGFDWDMRYRIIEGICRGLHYLHKECNIIHLDLKPGNILMDDNMAPKIVDFGLSRFFSPEQTRIITRKCEGTFGYMPPEYLFDGIISTKVDIFSFGVIIIQIITGHRKYPGGMESPQDFIEKVLKSWRNRLETVSRYISLKRCVEIGLSCLDADPKKRPTTGDIIDIFNQSTTSGVCNDARSPKDQSKHANSPANKEPTIEHHEEAAAGEDKDTSAHVSPVETLEEDTVITGEEDVLLGLVAELYGFDVEEEQWLERGTGTVKLLKHKEHGNVRLVMREAKTLRICANHLVVSMTQMVENTGNDKACVWYAMDFTDREPKLEFFVIRFKSVEDCKKFKDLVDEIAKSLSKMEGEEREDSSSIAGLFENLSVSESKSE